MASKRLKLSDKASLPFKTDNKQRRQALHVKRKRALDSERRAQRFGRKKEEAKNPRLREERLKRNVPLTLDRKRVWDDIKEDVEDGLGLSIDVERIKKRRQEEDQAKPDQDIDGIPDDEDNDSMLDDESADGDDKSVNEEEMFNNPLPSEKQLRTATQRATSPNRSTTSTNLNLAPEALAAKYPTLFNPHPDPKILITTTLNSTLHDQASILGALFPNSHYIRRSSHRYGAKYSIGQISSYGYKRGYTSLLVLKEDLKRPSGLTVVHLPEGPTFHFTISNWIDGKKMPGHGNPTSHTPELMLNNFRTPLGLLTAHLFRTLFPPQPELRGRQVVTLHNQRDYIFLRRHRYIFREKRETEKSVVGTDGKEVKGVEGIRAGLQELGPRFTLKLRRVDKGIGRKSEQLWEWKGKMEKTRTKFQL